MTFEKVQAEKVALASELNDKLQSMSVKLYALEEEDPGKVKRWFGAFALRLKKLKAVIERQKTEFCRTDMCETLLRGELQKVRSAIVQAERGGSALEVVEVIREALRTVISQELNRLNQAA